MASIARRLRSVLEDVARQIAREGLWGIWEMVKDFGNLRRGEKVASKA